MRLSRFILNTIGTRFGGNVSVPLSHNTIELNEGSLIASYLNNGFEIWIGNREEWHCFMKRRTFWKLVRWFVWTEIVTNWCGLRRWIYYKALDHECNFIRRVGKL